MERQRDTKRVNREREREKVRALGQSLAKHEGLPLSLSVVLRN